jgi:hypothetical protein
MNYNNLHKLDIEYSRSNRTTPPQGVTTSSVTLFFAKTILQKNKSGTNLIQRILFLHP